MSFHFPVWIILGAVERSFFAVPRGATWAELQVRLTDFSSPTTLVVHTQQVPGSMKHVMAR